MLRQRLAKKPVSQLVFHVVSQKSCRVVDSNLVIKQRGMLTDAFLNAMLGRNIAVQQCIPYANWSCRYRFSPLSSLVLLDTSNVDVEKETLDLIASEAQGKVSRAATNILNPHAAFLHPSGKTTCGKSSGRSRRLPVLPPSPRTKHQLHLRLQQRDQDPNS